MKINSETKFKNFAVTGIYEISDDVECINRKDKYYLRGSDHWSKDMAEMVLWNNSIRELVIKSYIL